MICFNQVYLSSVAKLMLEKYARLNISFQVFFVKKNGYHLMLSNLAFTMRFLIIGNLLYTF